MIIMVRVSQFWSENLWGRDHLRDLDIDGRIILKLILEKERRYGLD
jgi:hypothetical protein